MAEKFINARVQTRRDTLANWENENPVLLNGETVIVDTDDGLRRKVGDGQTPFADLIYDDELFYSEIEKVGSTSIIEMSAAGSKIDYTFGDGSTGTFTTAFIGTHEEYLQAYNAGQIAIGTIVIITDDEVNADATSAILGVGILGSMILQ